MTTVGIFGVTANPPHLSHLKAIESAASKVDELWVSPVYNHPFGKNFIEYEHRLKMLKDTLATSEMKNIFLKEVDKDFFLNKKSIVYTYDLLVFVQNRFPDIRFKMVIGADNYQPEKWEKFKNYKLIEREFGVIVENDVGVHSTDIRGLIKEDINSKVLKDNLVPEVLDYIKVNKLFLD